MNQYDVVRGGRVQEIPPAARPHLRLIQGGTARVSDTSPVSDSMRCLAYGVVLIEAGINEPDMADAEFWLEKLRALEARLEACKE